MSRIASVVLLALLAGVVAVAAPRVAAAEDPVAVLRLYSGTQRLLTAPQRAALRRAAASLPSSLSDDQVLDAGLKLVDKVVRDYGNLRFLYIDLDKLAADEYARTLAHIERAQFAPLKDRLGLFRAALDRARPSFDHPQRRLERAELQTILNRHASLFAEEVPTAHRCLDALVSAMTPARKAWDAKYEQLLARLRSGTEPTAAGLSPDEVRFLKVYGRVRMLVDLLVP